MKVSSELAARHLVLDHEFVEVSKPTEKNLRLKQDSASTLSSGREYSACHCLRAVIPLVIAIFSSKLQLVMIDLKSN